MDEDFKNKGDASPQLLDLLPNERDWTPRDSGEGRSDLRASEEKKLELRLGLPGTEEESSVPSLGYFSKGSKTANPWAWAKRGFSDTAESKTEGLQQQQQQQKQQQSAFFELQARGSLGKELSQRTSGKADQQQSLEKKAFFCPQPAAHATPGKAAGANYYSQTRTASTPVVGWPPIRSFRKNLASSSTKPTFESQNRNAEAGPKLENCRKGLFVKINMDGIPIGRKVDLKAYDSYEQLSSAVEELFRGLVAARGDTSTTETQKDVEEREIFTGLLDGTGEYTLVYEDNEGDRMLVGDIPWDMFVSNPKRLRVLKSTELSAQSSGAVSRKKNCNRALS